MGIRVVCDETVCSEGSLVGFFVFMYSSTTHAPSLRKGLKLGSGMLVNANLALAERGCLYAYWSCSLLVARAGWGENKFLTSRGLDLLCSSL